MCNTIRAINCVRWVSKWVRQAWHEVKDSLNKSVDDLAVRCEAYLDSRKSQPISTKLKIQYINLKSAINHYINFYKNHVIPKTKKKLKKKYPNAYENVVKISEFLTTLWPLVVNFCKRWVIKIFNKLYSWYGRALQYLYKYFNKLRSIILEQWHQKTRIYKILYIRLRHKIKNLLVPTKTTQLRTLLLLFRQFFKSTYFIKWVVLYMLAAVFLCPALFFNKITKNYFLNPELRLNLQPKFLQKVIFYLYTPNNYLAKIFKLSGEDQLILISLRNASKKYPHMFFNIGYATAFHHSVTAFQYNIVFFKTLYALFYVTTGKSPAFRSNLRIKNIVNFLVFVQYTINNNIIFFDFLRSYQSKLNFSYKIWLNTVRTKPTFRKIWMDHLSLSIIGVFGLQSLKSPVKLVILNKSPIFWGLIYDTQKIKFINQIDKNVNFNDVGDLESRRINNLIKTVNTYYKLFSGVSVYFTLFLNNWTSKSIFKTAPIRIRSISRIEGFFSTFAGYPVKINQSFSNFTGTYWPVRYRPSNFYKFNDLSHNTENVNFFLRKNKIFNKSRYSRNRQLYRTGVYMCLYLNVIFVYFYIFSFYRFAFVFSYLWLGIGVFLTSMVLGRAMKYRFYNPINFFNEIYEFSVWSGLISSEIWNFFWQFLKNNFVSLRDKLIIIWRLDQIFPILKKFTKKYMSEKIRRYFIKLDYYFNRLRIYVARLSLRLPNKFHPHWGLLSTHVFSMRLVYSFSLLRKIMNFRGLKKALGYFVKEWRIYIL